MENQNIIVNEEKNLDVAQLVDNLINENLDFNKKTTVSQFEKIAPLIESAMATAIIAGTAVVEQKKLSQI